MHIELSETRKNFPISRKVIFKKTTAATILLIILLGVLYFFGVYTFFLDLDKTGTVISILILVVILVGYTYERAYFGSYFYDLTNDYVIIKKNPIKPKEIIIPYDRISSVYIDRDPFDLLLGICDLHIKSDISSAGGMEAHIDGLSRASANGLVGVLTAKMNEVKDNKEEKNQKEQKKESRKK